MSDRTQASALLLLALAALLGPACADAPGAQAPTHAVRRGALEFRGSYFGELRARKSATILAPIVPELPWFSYVVASVIEDGTPVKTGDVVLGFDRPTVEEQLAERTRNYVVAEAERRKLEQGLEKERIDLELEVERKKKSLEKAKLGVVEGVNFKAEIEVEQSKLDVAKAELELLQAEKALAAFAGKRRTTLAVEKVKVDYSLREKLAFERLLGEIDVRSPADGLLYRPLTQLARVNNERVASGKTVRGGDKILEIPDLSAFDVHFYVRQRDATLIDVGDTAVVYATILPDTPIPGRVKRKDTFATTRNERLGTKTPEGNLKEMLVVVELEAAPEGLRPGGSVRLEILSKLADQALLLPLAAVRQTAPGAPPQVELADGALRSVRLGRATTTFAEVLSGLSEGEVVVLSAPPPPAP
jgi:multidrug resistance efflux pump